MPFINDKLNFYSTQRDREEPDIQEPSDESLSKKRHSRYIFQVEQVMDRLRASIFGQDEMMDRLEGMLYLIHADILARERPLYVSMLLGPTGVGKTETIRILAEAIYGDKDQFCRIDMNTLTQEHYAAALTGAPPGYVGSKEGNTLFDEEKIAGTFSKPGIVLFDEIEKADHRVIQTLLNVFDNGKMVISTGEKIIDFRNSLIFMTSNLGSKAIFDFANKDSKAFFKRLGYRIKPSYWGLDSHSLLERIVQEELKNAYTPEFLNRIDDICIYNWLEGKPAYSIVNKFIEELNMRINKHQFHIELNLDAKSYLLKQGFNKQYGARSIKRTLRKHIEIPLAKLIEASTDMQFTQIHISLSDNNELIFNKLNTVVKESE